MARTKDTAEAVRPYVKRAIEDPELRDDVVAAFASARELYEKISKGEGVKGKAQNISGKDFQKELQELVNDLSDASDRIKGEKDGHKARNLILLTGVTLGVLYNPWTGQATRDWIMERVSGGNGDGFEEFGGSYGSESSTMTSSDMTSSDMAPGNGSEPGDESKL